MKKHLAYFVTLLCMCLQSQANALPFFDLPEYMRWSREVTTDLQEVFNMVVPELERPQWKPMYEKPYIGDIGEEASWTWIPRSESEGKWTECLTCSYRCKPIRTEDRQYRSISEYFETYREDCERVSASPIDWTFTKINEHEAVIEKDKDNHKLMTVMRALLIGDWLLVVMYEAKPSLDPKKSLDWVQKRILWADRLSQVHFDTGES